MAEQVPAVGNILSLIERRDWSRLEQHLAPDVHWSTAVEEQLHGPAEVIACLKADPPPGPPAYHETDQGGRITRWIDQVG